MLIFVSSVTGRVSISSFASLVCVPVGVKSCSVVEAKICAITGGIQNYKEIIKKKKKKYDKTVLLGKGKLNIIEVLICKSLIDSYISHDELFSLNNLFREYNEMKEEIKSSV